MAYTGVPGVFEQSTVVSVPANGTANFTLSASGDSPILLNEVSVTLGATTSITSITVDGVSCSVANPLNFKTTYGDLVWCRESLVIGLSNGNTVAEDSTVVVKGLRLR